MTIVNTTTRNEHSVQGDLERDISEGEISYLLSFLTKPGSFIKTLKETPGEKPTGVDWAVCTGLETFRLAIYTIPIIASYLAVHSIYQ